MVVRNQEDARGQRKSVEGFRALQAFDARTLEVLFKHCFKSLLQSQSRLAVENCFDMRLSDLGTDSIGSQPRRLATRKESRSWV